MSPLGTVIGDADLSWQTWPKDNVASGRSPRARMPKALEELRGSIVRAVLFQGEPVQPREADQGRRAGLHVGDPAFRHAGRRHQHRLPGLHHGRRLHPAQRPRRRRADLPGGQPGQGRRGSGDNFVSETLLRNIRVLAIGQNVQEKNGQPVVVGSNATLELDPAQAETIILAQRTGQLSLTLRSMQDAQQGADAARASRPTASRSSASAPSAEDTGSMRPPRLSAPPSTLAGVRRVGLPCAPLRRRRPGSP